MTTQAVLIPTLIRPETVDTDEMIISVNMRQIVPPDVMYLPLVSFGRVVHTSEREIGRLREGELVSDLLDGQITDVAQVIAIDLANKSSWDATRDIADAVFNSLIRSGSNVPEWLVDFLESHIAMNELAPYLRNRLVA